MILVADGRQQASTSLLAVPCKQSRFPILIGSPETDTPPFMPFFYPMSWMTSALPGQRVFERASCPDRLLSADNDSVDVYHFNDDQVMSQMNLSKTSSVEIVRGDKRWITSQIPGIR